MRVADVMCGVAIGAAAALMLVTAFNEAGEPGRAEFLRYCLIGSRAPAECVAAWRELEK